jgi:DNA-binding transcriptional LysR family regulator
MDRFTEMQVFTRTVETGGFTSAALALDMTPSGVSKVIKRLEDRLDALLFKRTSRSIALTPEGEAYYERVRTVLSALDEAESAITDSGQDVSGTLRIFATAGFACHQLAPRLPEYHRLYPRVQVEFHIATGPLRTLDTNMDLGFYPFNMVDSAMVSRRLVQTRWVICAAPAYLEANGTPVRPADLLGHRCLSYTSPVPCNTWRVWDPETGQRVVLPIKGEVSTTDGEMLLALAKAGAGIVSLHEDHASDALASGDLVEILVAPPEAIEPQSVYAVYHSRRHLSGRASTFLSFLSESFADRRQWRRPDEAAHAPILRLRGDAGFEAGPGAAPALKLVSA